ncbi:RagB/SusD family nutrient uptake outer membrane protein [Proteiniphilum sp. X52]|uniref:RagB/SusD family nutrient uptake outer membrane protein n=1 Tax=Proteiniphilum sp. X52 TaxID=2382159 RepID=UPI000F0A1808|nr:RagB/SusD family nutrient uptake outer membrane protein [Proteiniphilum sp. X52]RNC65172.1 RagB/SusD family nutrient uptake outer membrane protein [Proteiniphilum sp. X52]
MKKIIYSIVFLLVCFTACEDYLDRPGLDQFENDHFWTNEGNVKLYAQRAYTSYFYGYGSGYSWGSFFTGGSWADEYSSSSIWTQNTATSGNGWSFTWVRWANILIDEVGKMENLSDEARNHWLGIGRFFRAMEYSDLARAFGDIPYFDKVVPHDDVETSYKKRDPLPDVALKIMEDFQFAAENVRINDGSQQVNRDVVLAFMSRHMLYFGTFLKYHDIDAETAATLLGKAAWASEQLMNSGKYEVVDDYRAIFSSENLSGNKEVIFYRQYEAAKVTHCLVSYNNKEPQTGTTLKVVETYLSADGLPIKQSPLYDYDSDNGFRYYEDQYRNRDPRMAASLVDSIRLNGPHDAYSSTGFLCWKFLPYEANDKELIYMGSTNTTDAPVIRYGEILLNYAEAMAELGRFDQAAADKSINLLRNRNIQKNNQGDVLPKLPKMVVAGDQVTANGVIVNDPDRDPSVSPLLWEIRRERAVELLFEGFRRNDLRRWKKFEYLKTMESDGPTTLGRGAYIDLEAFKAKYTEAQYNKMMQSLHFHYPDPDNLSKAFVHNLYETNMRRDWIAGNSYYERQYLNAVPLDQIKLYKDLGYELTQNYGWDGVD